jgi:class 3 adenylate cyclase
VDVRHALPLIQAPTLVLHVQESPFVPVDHGIYLAKHIPGASFVELPGGDLGPNPAVSYQLADEIAQFLTGVRLDTTFERVLTTVLFSDIVGSTQQAAALGDRRWRSLLDTHDRVVRDEIHRFRGREIKTTGDGFVASFDGPARAIRCAQAMGEATAKLGINLRAGLHTGECEVRGDDLGGLAVHISARVAALADAGEVLVSGTVKDLVVGSGIEFADQGERDLKGVPGLWRLFAVAG